MLRVEGLNCFYGNVQVLRDFALELKAGEVLCLLGRNGAGKTTLLKAIMGLALKPKLLVLDEPTQGLSEAEITNFCKLVREIAADATILLIEHNMDVVMELAQRITVMNNGAILAEGTPAEITADAAVQQAYLGA